MAPYILCEDTAAVSLPALMQARRLRLLLRCRAMVGAGALAAGLATLSTVESSGFGMPALGDVGNYNYKGPAKPASKSAPAASEGSYGQVRLWRRFVYSLCPLSA